MAQLPQFTVRIEQIVERDDTHLKAIASLTIEGSFCIHGLRVMDSVKGLFVQMPQASYVKGTERKYTDLFHPVTSEARAAINDAVLGAYFQELDKGQEAK